MSTFIRAHKYWLLPVVFASIALTILLSGAGREQPAGAAPDEIVLVTKDIAFRRAGRPDQPNPTLRLTRGNPVRLIIRNEEPEKILHCFTIAGLDVRTSRNLATGESETLTFTPREAGTFAYACLMHPAMTGKVIVQ